jgi:hypothetical protein
MQVAAQKYLRGFTARPVPFFYFYFHDWWYEK